MPQDVHTSSRRPVTSAADIETVPQIMIKWSKNNHKHWLISKGFTLTLEYLIRNTHVVFGPGDPSLQKKRKAGLVEPASGFHCNEDVIES